MHTAKKEMLLEAIDLGISKYFIKPFDIESFIEYLKELSNKINKEKDYTLKGGFVFVKNSCSLYKDSELINLTKKKRERVYKSSNRKQKFTCKNGNY